MSRAASIIGWLWLLALPALAEPLPGPAPAGPSARLLHDDSLCLGCHGPEIDVEVIRTSAHARLTCVDCHRDIENVPHSIEPSLVDCDRCHYQESYREFVGPAAETGVLPRLHRAAAEEGATGLPTCVTCHGTHEVRPAAVAASSSGKLHTVTICEGCHADIAAEYMESVHGQALAAGTPDAPACSDCHPEHSRRAEEGTSDILRSGVATTCGSCHEDPGLQRRYALPGNRLASYLGSYHGAAATLGDTRTANCASCHGVHHILPASDPLSTVNKANLAATCGECHPKAGSHFAEGTVHLQPSPTQDRAVFWVKVVYQLLVAGLMLGFLGYIALDLLARMRGRTGHPRHEAEGGEKERQFERLTLNQRIQHWALILSFAVLVATGFPLLYPQSGVSQGVVRFLGGVGLRPAVHRGAAILQIGLVLYHVLYVLFSRRGYWEFRQLLPAFQDAKDLFQMLRLYLGLGTTRPAFGRYNYIEKFEYLAVGWGSVIMIGTGLLLWAPHLTLSILPKWVMDITLVVHSWEALLAFLAIIVWHMYNVHWNPSAFPMSTVWLTGRIGEREFRENHPLEYQQQVARRREKGDDPK